MKLLLPKINFLNFRIESISNSHQHSEMSRLLFLCPMIACLFSIHLYSNTNDKLITTYAAQSVKKEQNKNFLYRTSAPTKMVKGKKQAYVRSCDLELIWSRKKHEVGAQRAEKIEIDSFKQEQKETRCLLVESRLETPSPKSDTWKHAGGAGEPTLRNVRRKD